MIYAICDMRDKFNLLAIFRNGVITFLFSITFFIGVQIFIFCYGGSVRVIPFSLYLTLYVYSIFLTEMLSLHTPLDIDKLIVKHSKYVSGLFVDPFIAGYTSKSDCAKKNTCALLFNIINLIFALTNIL